MAFQIPMMNSLFTITSIVLVIAVIAIILILILLKLYQAKGKTQRKPDAKGRRDKDGAAIVAPELERRVPEKLHTGPGRGRGSDLHDEGDILKNMQAFVEKYKLNSFTLSSDDGLVIASTSANGQGDAANYTEAYRNGIQSPEPGITIFGMTHHGSTIIGIMMSTHQIPIPVPGDIETDANNIMRWSFESGAGIGFNHQYINLQ
jgi:hypothetical protein